MMDSQYISPNKSDFKDPSQLVEKKTPAKVRVKDLSVSQLEQRLLDLVNKDRTKSGASLLTQSPPLGKLARQQADDMMRNKTFSHNNSAGLDVQQRAKQCGITDGVYENIADQSGPDPAAQMVDEIEASFMAEPQSGVNHRYILLDREHTHVGIGIAKSKDHVIVVQDFTNHDPDADLENK